MKKALSFIVSPITDSGSADFTKTDGAICKEAPIDAKLVTPNWTQNRLFIQPQGRLIA